MRTRRLTLTLILCGAAVAWCTEPNADSADSGRDAFRFGFSTETITEARKNSRMALATAGMDMPLLKAGLPSISEYSRNVRQKDLRRGVARFLRHSDACVVTRRGFDAMVELNPQIGRQMKAIAVSSPLVPSGFCFRRGYTGPLRKTIEQTITSIVSSPPGRQIQTLFQFGELHTVRVAELKSALALLDEHERLALECAGEGPL